MIVVVRPLYAYSPWLLLVVAAAHAAPVFAQASRYEGLPVVNIRFEPEDQPLDAQDINGILPLKLGQPLRRADVRASIERLFATGRYADIQVDAEPQDSGVAITFKTANRWFIGNISVTGNIASPPTAVQLETAGRLELGAPYTDSKLLNAIFGQKRLFENNGFYSNEVSPVLDRKTSSAYEQVNIRFDVDAGRRAHYGLPVIQGDPKLPIDKIIKATQTRRWILGSWKPVTQSRTRQMLDGIRRLYQKENRLEAKVTLDSIRYDSASNSAVPVISIYAGPRLELNAIGANLSRKDMRKYVPVFEEHAVDFDLLTEGARNLQDYFQSQGYFEAQVQFKQQRVINDRASIDYLIATGERHKLVAIEISGNRYFSTESIRERMFLRTASFLQFRRGRYSESLMRRDEEAIINLYQSNGFRDVRVSHRLQDDFRGKPGEIAVFIQIDEGEQSLIEDLRIDGVEKLDKTGLMERISSAPGQPFSEFNVAVDRDAILARYFDLGFPEANFEWSAGPGSAPNRIRLRYIVTEGREQTVRQVLTSGNTTTRPELLERNITLSPGDPLSPNAISDIQRRLYDLGVFAKVDAAIQNPDGDTSRKYVLFNVDEAKRYSYAMGFGADLGRLGGCRNCLEAPAGATGFSPRVSFDITRNNMWGVGHSLSLRTRASTRDRRALLNYSWPRVNFSQNLNLSFTALYQLTSDIRTANVRRAEVSAQLSQRLSKPTTIFYRFSYRRVGVSDLKVTTFLLGQLTQPVRVGLPSISIVQDRRDDPIEPHHGLYNTLDLGIADRAFGSQRNFLRVLLRNASYHPLGKRLVLARSTQFGNIYSYRFKGKPDEAVPLAERFFAGGGTSHRGFPEFGAGPRDISTGFPLGGRSVLFNQTELRFPLIGEDFGGVLFHDAGNVYSKLGNLSVRYHQRNLQDFDYAVHAVGFGIRYRTPIGPVRADFGYTLNPPYFFGFEGSTQDLINAGANPCSPPPGVPNRCSVQNVSHFQWVLSIGQTF